MLNQHKETYLTPPKTGVRHVLRRLWWYLRPYRLQVCLIVLGMLLDLAFDTALRLSFKFLIDAAIVPHNYPLLLWLLAGLSGGILLAAFSALARDYLYARLGTSVLNDLRIALFAHLQRLAMRFYTYTPPGDILARFTTDLTAVETALVQALPVGLFALLGLVVAMVPLCILEWRLALGAIAALPLCLLGPVLLKKPATGASYQLKEEQAKVANTVQENIGAQAVVKAFGLHQEACLGFQRHMQTMFRLGVRANFLSYVMERTPNLATLLLELLVIAVGALMAYHGSLSVGALVSFHVLFLSVSQSVYSLTWTLPNLVQAAVGLQRIEELLQVPAEVINSPTAMVLPRLTQAIALQHVTFGYTAAQVQLADVSLRIPRGHFVAFVGPSGAGKSTLLNLLLRFYDPTHGVITVDGIDIRTVTQESLRAQMGVVLQENILFNISIRDNLRLGYPQATEADIEAAARAAEIHEAIVRLPHGYDTLVGERGGRLSGGQRQRLAIARALIRNPAILILDEATAAIDPTTEAALNATLQRVGQGRTVIAVTHRLSTITHADCIFVLSQSRVVEYGTHTALLQHGGVYAQMWDKQSGFTFSDDDGRAQIQVQRLRCVPILERLDDRLLTEVAQFFVTEQYPQDHVVVSEGEGGDLLYIIVRGLVAVLKTNPQGQQQQIAVLQDGDFFGEATLLRHMPRTATIRTLSPCILLSLQRKHFTYLLSKAQHLREVLEDSLQKRLDMQTALFPPTSER